MPHKTPEAGNATTGYPQKLLKWSLTPLIVLLSACTSLPPRPDLPPETALPTGDGVLDRLAAPAEARNPGKSAFRLVVDGREAFALRAHSARAAARSLDIQTYIWHEDSTGLHLAALVLEAADRGVRVRMLLDDMDARAKSAGIAALSAHPNIQVRLFNPLATRAGKVRLVAEGLRDFSRLNHRMHNKTWIADNRIALVGGRNIGDEYYGASDEKNFSDLDFAMIGPVVREISASFDRYWNSSTVYPISAVDAGSVSTEALARVRADLAPHARAAAATLHAGDAVHLLTQGEWPVEWTERYRFVADDPAKPTMAEGDENRSQVAAALRPLLAGAATEVTIISPYFVPGGATPMLAGKAKAGTSVRILTNSLVANDVAAVHGGYSRHRPALLEGGVQLWELKPHPGDRPSSSLMGSSGASLHTKALSVDRKALFVGSYNLDPRSTWLNCEQGVLVESAALANQFERIFAAHTTGARSWKVTTKDSVLTWTDGTETFDSDPQASAWRRFQAWLVRALGLDPQL
ncbi:phospholipase D family protein [Usitatibacter palustris]|nr:phospholipase D family protein [Usitatibacter palustris]